MTIHTAHNLKSSGFTIVELLIVIVVIGILAAIVIIGYNGISSRATHTSMRQDLSTIRKVIAMYHADNGHYPDSSLCTSVAGEYNYQDNWCGWDQGQGDAFIPGVVPTYVKSLPILDRSLPQRDTYLYQSRAADGESPGTADYQLIRFRSPALGGLSEIEMKENADLMTGGPGGYTGAESWGFRSNTSGWW